MNHMPDGLGQALKAATNGEQVTHGTRRGAGTAFIAAVVLALTACSEGGVSDGAGAGTEAALKVCEEVFGAAGVAEARAVLGETGLRAESQPLERTRQAMVKEARDYVPGSEDLLRLRHEPCRMWTADGDNGKQIGARVKWSVYSMGSVTMHDTKRQWTKVANDVYVQWEQQPMDALEAVLPCRVPGAAAGQERELPLEISVRSQALGAGREALSGKLLTALVRDTQKRLGCEKPVAVPDSLLPQ